MVTCEDAKPQMYGASVTPGSHILGTSFSNSDMSLTGPPCNAVICCRRDAPLFAARRSRRSRALVWVGVSPGRAPVEAAEGESAISLRCCWRRVRDVCSQAHDNIMQPNGWAEVIGLALANWFRQSSTASHACATEHNATMP